MTRVMVAMSLDRVLPEMISKVHEKYHTPVNAHLVYFLASIPIILCYNLVPGWVGLTLGVTFGCGYVFIISCLAGALLPYKAKEVYESSPGAKYMVNGFIGLLATLIGVVGFIWISWVLAIHAFGNYPLLVWLTRIGAIAAVFAFLWPMRKHIGEWFSGKPMPLLSALGMLGGGLGMAMVVSFLLEPALGVLGNWNFEAFPTNLWAQIIAFGMIILSAVWYWLVKNAQKGRGINVENAFREIPPE